MAHVKRPTIMDVARAAGVSPATVSNALTGKRPVDAKTRLRVQDVVAALRYLPDSRAQRLRTGHPAAIAIVSSMPPAVAAGPSRLGFMMEIAASASVAALESGLAVVLVPPLDAVAPSLGHLDVGGALVVEPVEGDLHLQLHARPGLAGREHRTSRAAPDHSVRRSPARATPPGCCSTTLHGAGARNIALLAGSQRRNSYIETVREYRIASRRRMAWPRWSMLVDERGGEEAGYAAALRSARGVIQEVDAICAPVDAFAVGAVQACQGDGTPLSRTALKVATRYDGLRCQDVRAAADGREPASG